MGLISSVKDLSSLEGFWDLNWIPFNYKPEMVSTKLHQMFPDLVFAFCACRMSFR